MAMMIVAYEQKEPQHFMDEVADLFIHAVGFNRRQIVRLPTAHQHPLLLLLQQQQSSSRHPVSECNERK